MENSTSGNRVHHCRHPWRSRRSNDDVKDEHESLELHEFFSVLRLFVRFVRFVFKKNFAFNDTMENTRFKISQYACAVLLIVSSIALVSYQVIMIDDVSNGLLVYVAQAFLLVASIFGLDYYVKLITRKINGKHSNQ